MKNSLRRSYGFFLAHYFVQGAVGIAYEPMNYLLKDHLQLSPGKAAGFWAWTTLPFLFKPLYGLVTDFFPIRGYRRKAHLAIGALTAAGAFFGLALERRYTFMSLLWPTALSCFALAFADVACGGLLVEDGKARHETGRYQALHIGALYFSAVLVGIGGGWMTAHVPFSRIFALTGVLPLAIFALVFFIHEDSTGQRSPRSGTIAFWSLIRTRAFWGLSLTILLWNFYPFLGTVQFYYQSNVLGLSPQWIGSLMTIGSVAGLIGSAAFWKLCRGRNTDAWVSWGPAGMALVSLSYLFYRGSISVAIVEALFGFASVFFRLALLDLIARTCPANAEATSYALFLALFDLAMFGSNALGGKLYDALHRALAAHAAHDQMSYIVLILIGAGCTLACRWTLKYCRIAST